MSINKYKFAILNLVLLVVALSFILFGSLFVFSVVGSSSSDGAVISLGVGIELQLIGGLILIIKKLDSSSKKAT
ncbi:hypothetical protein [Candidatus Bathycorpusculum sp.]|uniref:hypothetical protein n=1 Tax=Candidatus Bathycorpusculum sp. TaxID=2994959 RepID=UPI0028373E8C|nr:hypothetical protein [Candidatus Termitimicrobium sp.]MCL2686715.1 hypothetical protein [Candidatus Termitimicrobium sp.]